MTDAAESHPFLDRDILVPLTDPWDAQSQILVISEHGNLRFHQVLNEEFETLDGPPEAADVYIRPRGRTAEYAAIARVENVLSRAIDEAGGKLKLEPALRRVGEMGIGGDDDAEGLLRYLVSRGDFRAEITGKKKTVRLSLSDVTRAREDHRSYASSFAHELGVQSEQVGRLIGHGPTVGSKREELLRALIERHVPRRFHVATGFVEGSDRQIDILIYDQIEHAPLFRAGNLVVVPIEAVRAVIEVKSILTGGALSDALQHLQDAIGVRSEGPPVFRGVFGYRGATAETLVDAIVQFHRHPTDWNDAHNSVNSIYDMADAVCVLRKTVLITDFFDSKWRDEVRPTPCVAELGSEAGRDIQAALFFDRLLRFLRYPFDGPLVQPAFGSRFGIDVENRKVRALYPDEDWGPFIINAGIAHVKAQIAAYHEWLAGKPWIEPPPDEPGEN